MMRILLMLPLVLFELACHNTNPEKGTGGNKVNERISLSSRAIVDSTKALLDQKSALDKKRVSGEITSTDYTTREQALKTTYTTLYKGLSPDDTVEVTAYRKKLESELMKDTSRTNILPRWE